MTEAKIREGLTATLEPLTTKETFIADRLIGQLLGDEATPGALALMTSKVYALCSVRSIKSGELPARPVAPLAGGAGFDDVCAQFMPVDLVTLMEAYGNATKTDEAPAKNSSSAETPSPST